MYLIDMQLFVCSYFTSETFVSSKEWIQDKSIYRRYGLLWIVSLVSATYWWSYADAVHMFIEFINKALSV